MRKIFFLLAVFVFSAAVVSAQDITQGSLYAAGKKGELGACPLKRTVVRADVSGFMTRVTVTQEFENSFNEPIEAVYTFPLSQTAAVDRMTMKIGERNVGARIMRREEARRVYQTAKTEGKTASLLDEERPNVFTQSVANILPNEKILIEISYVETLKFEDGAYEFVFPMVVGPRYVPAADKDKNTENDENDENDAEQISPPVDDTRAGHDISIEVNLDTGVAIEQIRSTSHEIRAQNLSATTAKVSLKTGETIPNKDFVLRYDVTGQKIEDAILTHTDERGGFFTLMLQPPDRFAATDVTPKEIVFVLDTSGSMDGFPIEKAKEAIRLSLENLYPYDTFNLITFAGETEILFEKPVPATEANLEKALAFLDEKKSGGGTEMMKAIKTALEPTDSQEHLRIVCFMTDGYVSNEAEIIGEVQKHPRARVFSFGIGDGVNRYLLDKIAQEGRGEVEYVSLADDGSRAAKRFYERVRTPLLTDISVDWNGLPIADVYPNKINDLFSAKPVVLHGRYTGSFSGTIRLRGKMAGQPYEREIAVNFSDNAPDHDVLPTLWARTKIDDLMDQSYKYDSAADSFVSNVKTKTKNEIIELGLKYNLLTEFTSFVAVEERIVTRGGKTRKIKVPVYAPAGTTLEEGEGSGVGYGSGGGMGSGSGNGNGMGSGNNSPVPLYGVSSNSDASVDKNPMLARPTPVPKTISGGVVKGRAVTLVEPSFPQADAKVSGAVDVQILIDETGGVIFARAVSGHPLLRVEAEKAARLSKFTPTLLDEQPIRAAAVIVYNFDASANSAAAAAGETSVDEKQIRALVEEMRIEAEKRQTRAELAEKLHFWVFALAERLQKNEPAPTANEAKFVAGGKAEIELRLTTKSAAAFNRLRELGFEIVEDKKAKIVVGRIRIEKIADLARIDEVRYVLPKVR